MSMTMTMPDLPPISPRAAAADFTPHPRRGVNVASFLIQTAKRLPDAPAVIDPIAQDRLTWRQLAVRAAHTASQLHAAGVGRRDTVMLLSSNHVEMVQGFWAIMHAGAVVAPPNAALTPAEITQLAETTAPAAIIAHVEAHAAVAAVQKAGYAARIFWIGTADADPDTYAAADALAPVTAASALAEHTGDDICSPAVVSPDDPCWYFFTSGSTGAPKAAVFTHHHLGIVLLNHNCDLFPGEDHTGASLVVAPISHGAGVHLLAQVFAGCPSILYTGKPFDGGEAWELIDDWKVTNMFTVPTILNRVVAGYPVDRPAAQHSLQYVIYAGAPLLAADQERAIETLGDCLVQYFGLGEVTGSITALRPEEHGIIPVDAAGIGTCGRARTGVEICVQDDTGQRLPAGEPGEVCVAGPTVCGGYLNNPSANAEAFADGWFHTGDIGYLDEAGYLFLTGRKSDMYISGGSNIYPREIEELLLTHPDVRQVAVIGVPDPRWGEVGVAVVEAEAPVSAETLTSFLTTRLAKYKIPKEFRFVETLPVTAYGKIARKELKQQLSFEREQETGR